MSILLITGASSEIGTCILEKFSDHYNTVWAHYRTENDSFNKTCDERKNIRKIQADFQSEESINHMLNEIEQTGIIPDTIVHLPAPKYSLNNFNKESRNYFEMSYEISVLSIVSILQRLIPYMTEKEEGRIIFMLSSCTVDMPPSYTSAYTAVKYALLGLLKELSVEYKKNKILINGISPDMVETKFLSDISRFIVQKNAKDMPSGRNLNVEDLMPVFGYLMFESRATGQNFVVQSI